MQAQALAWALGRSCCTLQAGLIEQVIGTNLESGKNGPFCQQDPCAPAFSALTGCPRTLVLLAAALPMLPSTQRPVFLPCCATGWLGSLGQVVSPLSWSGFSIWKMLLASVNHMAIWAAGFSGRAQH